MKEIMWHKDYNMDVEVYSIEVHNDRFVALCYVPALAGRQNGNGWERTKISRLVPYPYAECVKTGMSKTERNQVKALLKLTHAEWTCTDGTVFTHDKLDDAIEYQRNLLEGEIGNE